MSLSAYQSPGVSVSESTNPSVAPLTAVPSEIAIVGTAAGFQTSIERYILNGTTAQNLQHTGVNTSSVVVVNLTQASKTVSAGNFVVALVSDPDSSLGDGDEIYSIRRLASPSGAPVLASSGTGSLTGTYSYGYTWVTPSGVVGETGLSPAAQVTLASAGTDLASISVGPTGTTARNIYRAKVTGSVVGTYYRVATISDNSTTSYANENMSDNTAANQPNPPQGIADGDTVQVTYNYTDIYYYSPTLFDNFPDVVDKYGPPFDANGNISSQLTFAIRMAFLNGAPEVLGLAVTDASSFGPALDKLLQLDNVSMVSVVSSSTSDHATLAAHCASASLTGQYRIGVVGQDSSSVAILPATLRSSAQAFNVENMVLVSPSSFKITNPVTLQPTPIGAQYMASAILGMCAARDPQVPLTRKTVAGFIVPNEIRTTSDAALDSAAGLCLIEYKGNLFRVRHSLTTAVTDINKREISVVRSKYEMARQLRVGLDGSIVGMVVPQDQAPLIVSQAVTVILDALTTLGTISTYDSVVSRVLASNPTTVETRFEYTPAYPINNISVIFTINTLSGDFALNF